MRQHFVAFDSFSDFLTKTEAVKQTNGTWIVFIDPIHKAGGIEGCNGSTEYEAKEHAWEVLGQMQHDILIRRQMMYN